MRNVAGAAAAVVGHERLSFERGTGRRHRFWSMNERIIEVNADS